MGELKRLGYMGKHPEDMDEINPFIRLNNQLKRIEKRRGLKDD